MDRRDFLKTITATAALVLLPKADAASLNKLKVTLFVKKYDNTLGESIPSTYHYEKLKEVILDVRIEDDKIYHQENIVAYIGNDGVINATGGMIEPVMGDVEYEFRNFREKDVKYLGDEMTEELCRYWDSRDPGSVAMHQSMVDYMAYLRGVACEK